MKRTMIPCSLALVAGGVMALSGFADYDVLLNIEGGSRVERYSVSADGTTWTKGANFLASSTPMNFAAPGDGYVYVPNGTTIDRYTKDGAKVDSWKSGLSGKTRIFLSPDHVWFYIANNWNSSENVARYRVSDPSIGGFLSLNDAAHGSLNGTNNRDITFGRDGVMYLGCRGNDIPDPTAANYGTNNIGRGVFAYDVTVSGAPLLKRYPLDGNKSGVGVFIDDDRDRLIANDTKFRYFKLGDITQYQEAKTSPGGTAFYTFNLGSMKFFGDYNGKVHRYNPANDTYTTVALDSSTKNVAAISDVTDVNSGSQLPYITGVWYMNESTGTKVINGANPGVMDIETSGPARTGFRGASRNGLLVLEGGVATVKNSAALVPATGDFTIGVWIKAGTGLAQVSNGSTAIGVDADGKPFVTAGGVTAKGTASVASAWHALMALRSGNTLTLLVDNATAASQSLDAATALDQTANWTLTAKAANFDELRVYSKLLTVDDRRLLYDLVAPESAKAHFDDKNIRKLGSLVVHNDPVSGPVAAPSLVGLGNSAYVTVDGSVYCSTDGGATWTMKGSVGLTAVSLFVEGSSLYAVGLDANDQLALGTTSDGGANWSTSTIGGGLAVPTLAPTQPVVANNRVWLGASSSDSRGLLAVSFAFSGGSASDPKLATPTLGYTNLVTGTMTAVGSDGVARVYGSMRRTNAAFGEGFAVVTSTASASTYLETLGFPAASKPAAIAYDAVTKRYWLVTAAWHMNDRDANTNPYDRAPALALYSSADLENWYFHGDFTDKTVPVHFRSPSLAIVGDNLVIAVRACLDDGEATYSPSGETLQNLVAVRVANFRKFWTPRIGLRAYHPRELLLCEETDALVSRHYLDESTGDWLPSGILCRKTDVFKTDAGGDCSPKKPLSARTYGDRVFVASLNAGSSPATRGIYEFKKDGTFVRYYPLTKSDPDGFCISQDGTKFYTTAWWGTSLYTIDRASNAFTETTGVTPSGGIPRGVADIGNGKLAISVRKTPAIIIYDTKTGTKETISAFGTTDNSGPMDIFYEPETDRLYLSGNNGNAVGTGYYDFGTKKYVMLAAVSFHGLTRWDETSLVGMIYGDSTKLTTAPGRAQTMDESATALTRRSIDVQSCGGLLNRCCVITNPKPQIGLIVTVK